INSVLDLAGLPRAHLKYELAEIALVEPPPALNGLGVTIMDGPFFSCMPYPVESLYSLTHVRYTPHSSWTDGDMPVRATPDTQVAHMIRDGQRFLPCLAEAEYKRSIFDIKTVLLNNEQDDGRPILYQQRPENSRVISILGGKIDNIYDLFDLVRQTNGAFAEASDAFVLGRAG
ncbi:MAG: FAD-binding oxidoreductase, partial [Pseudomonadota bacterium]